MKGFANLKGCPPPIRWCTPCCKRSTEMPVAFFITGTDTDVGKTRVAVGLLRAARLAGMSTAAAKPLAAGCELTAEGLRNGDALALLAECSEQLSYAEVNPFAFAPAIAPHLAAGEEGLTLEVASLVTAVQVVLDRRGGVPPLRGAGGGGGGPGQVGAPAPPPP